MALSYLAKLTSRNLIGLSKEVIEKLEFSGKNIIVPFCEEFGFEEFLRAYDKLVDGKPDFICGQCQ